MVADELRLTGIAHGRARRSLRSLAPAAEFQVVFGHDTHVALDARGPIAAPAGGGPSRRVKNTCGLFRTRMRWVCPCSSRRRSLDTSRDIQAVRHRRAKSSDGLLRRKTRKKTFTQLARRGPEGARLYGLCGLRALRSVHLPDYLSLAATDERRVALINGCSIYVPRVREAVQNPGFWAICDEMSGAGLPNKALCGRREGDLRDVRTLFFPTVDAFRRRLWRRDFGRKGARFPRLSGTRRALCCLLLGGEWLTSLPDHDLLGVMSCGGQSGGVVLPSGTGRKLQSQHARLSGWSAGVWRRGLLLWAPGPYASRERLCDIGVVDFERGTNVDRL